MLGNVYEWTQGCWRKTYLGAPSEGTAWTSGDCSRRVLRGGSWNFIPWFVRSAYRSKDRTSDRSPNIGFRVSRMHP